MATISILKIESATKTILFSKNSKQEITPLMTSAVQRNINDQSITFNSKIKLKSFIETNDQVEIDIILRSEQLKIHSIVKFRESGTNVPSVDYVKDSIEQHDGYIIFRPILNMFITGFSCKCSESGTCTYRLEFEEA